MHHPAESEKQMLSVLFKSSSLNRSWQEDMVTGEQKKSLCGWKQVRPSARYVVPSTPSITKRQKATQGSQVHIPQQDSISVNCALSVPQYMSGSLDDDYSYVCRDGLSSEAYDEERSYPPYTHSFSQAKSTIELEPALPYKYPDASIKTDISKIVSMQLKPEILVEQLLIENRLRTMSLGTISSLEGVGVNSDSKTAQIKSDSAPLLRKTTSQTRTVTRNQKRKPQPPLEWCKLNTSGPNGSSQLPKLQEEKLKERLKELQAHQNDIFPFRNFSYSQQKTDSADYRHTLSPLHRNKLSSPEFLSTTNNSSKPTNSTIRQSVPVVEPTLERTAPMNGHIRRRRLLETKGQPPNTLTSLLKLWQNTPVRF